MRRAFVCLIATLGVALFSGLPFPAEVRAESAPLRCAGFEVVADRPSTDVSPSGSPTRARVVKRGRTVWMSTQEVAITETHCQDVTGDRIPELLFETYSGGAHCCTTVYIVSLKEPIRLILRYDAGNADVEVADLNHDGRPELLLGDDSFAYFDDLCYACSPSVPPIVACYRNGRFEDCTRQFPNVVREQASNSAVELRELAKRGVHDASDLQYIRGAALSLYAPYVLLGQETRGWAAVRAIVSIPEVLTWLAQHRMAVRRWAATRAKARLTSGK